MASINPSRTSAPSLRIGARSGVHIWLLTVAALVFAMVLIGGATRLTDSGLSITQWKPVTGVIPPVSAADWQAEFDRYKQIPQFAKVNPDMTIEGFGAAFVLPGLWFWTRGELKGALGRQVAVATGLLALEPIVGWWMVTSGLSDRTEVAQERLALHLMIAAATFGALIYAGAGLSDRARAAVPRGFVGSAAIFAAVVWLQLGLGALVAGLRAGLIYNTWPLMGSRFLPGEAFGSLRSPLDDPATAQFDHRVIAYALVVFALVQALTALRSAPLALAQRTALIAGVAALQAGLGVATLVFTVPIALALAHQATALVLLGLAVWHWRATLIERGA
jgi:heme a synthase